VRAVARSIRGKREFKNSEKTRGIKVTDSRIKVGWYFPVQTQFFLFRGGKSGKELRKDTRSDKAEDREVYSRWLFRGYGVISEKAGGYAEYPQSRPSRESKFRSKATSIWLGEAAKAEKTSINAFERIIPLAAVRCVEPKGEHQTPEKTKSVVDNTKEH